MKQIYNFEHKNPPALNESMLKAELEKRRLRRQTTLAAIAGILMQIALLLLSVVLWEHFMYLSIACALYVIFSATGSTVVAILLHSDTGRRALHQA